MPLPKPSRSPAGCLRSVSGLLRVPENKGQTDSRRARCPPLRRPLEPEASSPREPCPFQPAAIPGQEKRMRSSSVTVSTGRDCSAELILDFYVHLADAVVPGDRYRVAYRLRARSSVTDNRHASYPKQRRATVFCVVQSFLELPERRSSQNRSRLRLQRSLQLVLQ